MTIRDMKVFLAVCETQSMSAAAAKLSISQSAVSQAIREIERHFDTKLFERIGNKVYLTDSGRNMAGCSTHIVSYLAHMESLMRSDRQRALLHVGSFGPSLLVDLVKGYERTSPSTDIVMHVHSPSELLSLLSTGVLDLIITDSKPNLPGLITHHIYSSDAAFICHPESKLHPALTADHPFLQIRDLKNIPLLLRDEGNHSRIQFEEIMLDHNINFFCKGTFTSYEGIFSAVDCDLGIGLTTGRIARKRVQNYKLVTVAGVDIRHEVYLSHLARKEHSTHLLDFISYAQENISRLFDELNPIKK